MNLLLQTCILLCFLSHVCKWVLAVFFRNSHLSQRPPVSSPKVTKGRFHPFLPNRGVHVAKRKPGQKLPVASTPRSSTANRVSSDLRLPRTTGSEAKQEASMTTCLPLPLPNAERLLSSSSERAIEMWRTDEQPISLAEILMDDEDVMEKTADPMDGMGKTGWNTLYTNKVNTTALVLSMRYFHPLHIKVTNQGLSVIAADPVHTCIESSIPSLQLFPHVHLYSCSLTLLN